MIGPLLVAEVLAATPVAPPEAEAARVFVQTGVDDAVLPLTIGYGHGVAWGERDLQIRGSVTLPLAAPGGGDLLVSAGTRFEVVRTGTLRLDVSLDGSAKRTVNAAYRATGLATTLGASYGWVREPGEGVARGGYALLTSAVRQTWAARVRPSDDYIELVYPGAQTGWYGLPGGYVDAGLAAGWQRSRGISGGLAVGYRAFRRFTTVLPPPVYARIELAYDW